MRKTTTEEETWHDHSRIKAKHHGVQPEGCLAGAQYSVTARSQPDNILCTNRQGIHACLARTRRPDPWSRLMQLEER